MLRRSSPSEANLSNLESTTSSSLLILNSTDGCHRVWTEDTRDEFSADNLATLRGTRQDPERFLKPESRGGQPFWEREVNANKILAYMINFMDDYYDLRTDSNSNSRARVYKEETFWDNMAYVIPVLCRQVVDECFHDDPIVTSVHVPAFVIGDIHGNFTDIWYIYHNVINNKRYENYKIVFLGDYVDRGPMPLEILVFLFSLKLVDPERIIMLRGNHEVTKVNKKYGFKCLVTQIYEDTGIVNANILHKLIYNSINAVFDNLPLAAVIKARDKLGIFCCHGGLPSEYLRGDSRPWTVDEINRFQPAFKPHNLVPKKRCPVGQSVLNEILWNDPIPIRMWRNVRGQGKLFYNNKKRGGHCSWFTEEATNRFLHANHLRLIIRGHQFKSTKNDGYAFSFRDNQVLTVFSSSNYCGTESNVTGCVVIDEEGHVRPKVLRSLDESKRFKPFNQFELIVDRDKNVIGVIH